MKNRTALTLGFSGSFFVVGLPYWFIPYSDVSLPNAVWSPTLFIVAAFAVITRAASVAGFWHTVLIIGAAIPAAVLARVVGEGIVDPTSHNLWPFELILSAGPGFLASVAGALLGELAARYRRYRTGHSS